MRTSYLVRFAGELFALVLAACVLVAPGVARAAFGVEPGSFSVVTSTAQAGAHPDETFSFKLNTTTNSGTTVPAPDGGDVRDTVFDLPAGFAGDPNATVRCPEYVLTQTDKCPSDTAVGVAHVLLHFGGGGTSGSGLNDPAIVPVYDMVPGPGQVALLGFNIENPSLVIGIHVGVRSAGDYGLTGTTSDISQVAVAVAVSVTLWGVPADHVAGDVPRAFTSSPTACSGQPLTSTLDVDSWPNPGATTADGEPLLSDPNWLVAQSEMPALTGCEKLVFDPSLTVVPETSAVDTPTGLSVDLHVPQNEDPYGLATPDLRNSTVMLPAGVAISPAAASGLAGCTPQEIGLHTENPVACPDASKLGTVRVLSPDLPRNADGSEGALTGFVYLGEPASGAITGPPYMLYIVAEGYGVSVRLAGTVALDPVTGQISTSFLENPQLPFEDLKLDFFGGPHAVLMTPPACGNYTTSSQLTPSSSALVASPSSTFGVSFDGNGAACPAPLPFAPSFNAGSTSTAAGGFTSFVANISRADGQQALSGISLSPPLGLLGVLAGVSLCGEPQAAQGTCPAASQIGTASAAAGAGPEPFGITGPVYLTGPYRGAPFGLSVAIPAVAGPFDLGTVVVRSAIYVNPHTAQLVVVSDPLPQMVDTSQGDSGVPVALQSVSVNIDRPGFLFNPTSCDPTSVTGTLTSNEGASTAVSSPFQVGGCAALAFRPSFAVSTQARTSKQQGASLTVRVASGSGQANIRSAAVTLPKQLPARLTTIQQACPEAVFAANPAGCPVGSVIGTATASTPILANPVRGPAILVSHGGAAFPDLVVILQGENVTVELIGSIDIKHGVTSSTFATVPDAPISSFQLSLPEGPHSGLAAVVPAKAKGSLCGQSLVMPTVLTGQNGVRVTQQTKITVTGCPRAKKAAKGRATKASHGHGNGRNS
jgi:hypothetical protein